MLKKIKLNKKLDTFLMFFVKILIKAIQFSILNLQHKNYITGTKYKMYQ